MRKSIPVFSLLMLLCIAAYSAVYVKGNLHFHSFYDSGVLQPEEDAVYEWWFSKSKLSYVTPRWRFTLDKEKNQIIAVNQREKFFVEISLPMNLLSHLDKQLAESLKQYQINGKVTKTSNKKSILQKPCDVYKVSEWIIFQNQRFYDRERTIMVSEDVPFDWQLLNQLYSWIRSFFKPDQSYKAELKKVKGFILASDDIRYQEGDQVKYNFKVIEINQKEAPAAIFDIPKSFKKKEKFTRPELIDIRTTIYFYYR